MSNPATSQSARYELGPTTRHGVQVVDLNTGKAIFNGHREAAEALVQSYNEDNVQILVDWETVGKQLVLAHLDARPLPWSIQTRRASAEVVASNGTIIAAFSSFEFAAWFIRFAAQLEFEAHPRGRRR